jgi:hypothetical protein
MFSKAGKRMVRSVPRFLELSLQRLCSDLCDRSRIQKFSFGYSRFDDESLSARHQQWSHRHRAAALIAFKSAHNDVSNCGQEEGNEGNPENAHQDNTNHCGISRERASKINQFSVFASADRTEEMFVVCKKIWSDSPDEPIAS